MTRIVHTARLRSPNVPTPSRDPDRMSIMSDDDFLSEGSVYSFDYSAPPNADDEPVPRVEDVEVVRIGAFSRVSLWGPPAIVLI